MSKFNWKRLRDIMMEYDQKDAYTYVYEIMRDIFENEGFQLNDLSVRELRKITNLGLGILYQCYDEELGKYVDFDYVTMIGITEMLYRKYPEVRERWNDGIWLWKE